MSLKDKIFLNDRMFKDGATKSTFFSDVTADIIAADPEGLIAQRNYFREQRDLDILFPQMVGDRVIFDRQRIIVYNTFQRFY